MSASTGVKKPAHLLRASIVVLALAIFALDVVTDVDIDIANLYVIVIFLAVQSGSRRTILLTGCGCIAISLLGHVLSPGNLLGVTGVTNRLLAIVAIGAVTYLGLKDQAARQALRENRQLLQGIIDFTDDAIISKKLDGTVTSWNPAAERLFGYSAQEAIGHSKGRVIPLDRADEEARILECIGRGERIEHFETTRVRSDGALIDISATTSPLKDYAGRIIGASEIIRDITGRKAYERKLRDQLARMSLLQQVTRAIGERQDVDSIYQVVIRSLEDDLPVDFAAVALCDSSEPLVVIKHVGTKSRGLAVEIALSEEARIPIDENGLGHCVRGELVYEPDISETTHRFPARLAGVGLRALAIAPLAVANSVFGVVIAARRNPSSFASSDCEFLLQLSDHVALAVHHAQLYRDLEQAYEDLRRTQDAVMHQERLRALGQMASGIAHDISNTLTPAALYAQTLLETNPNLSHEASHSLRVIQQAVEDAGNTLGRLQEFYRSKEPDSVGQVDLNAVLQQVVDITRARWSSVVQERGVFIELCMDLAPNLPPIVGSDNEIRDALTNLILNAVDAMPGGGTLTLRSRPREGGNGAASRVCAEVIDTGVGMSEAVRKRCLEPFFTTKGERGTGLGLAMVHGMLQRHGADFDIESAPGRGTIFRIHFPAIAAPPVMPKAPSSQGTTPLRLLLVDDDPLILRSLRQILESDGHEVSIADGGQAGIDQFLMARKEGRGFHIVITDLGMPKINGRMVAAAVKATDEIPVIVLSGWGQHLKTEDDPLRHVDRILNKPPRVSELRAALSELAAQSPETAQSTGSSG